MSVFQVQIMAADRFFYNGPCESLVIPSSHGALGILAHHRNMMAAIKPGPLSFRAPGQEDQFVAVSSGILKVENNVALVLVDSIERPEEIDANRARREADAAKEAILQRRSRQEYHAAQAALARALNRLRIKNLYG